MKKFGIIGAMDEETIIIKEKMEVKNSTEMAGMTFHEGIFCNKDVVLVRCGIGKVNAAICTQILISNFKVDTIINTGVAGAVDSELNIGDVVISKDVLEHDFDVTNFGGYKLGQIPRMDTWIFGADEKLIEAATKARNDMEYKTKVGRVLSGDVFVACKDKKAFLWNEFGGLCTEMEGASIGHTCHVNKVPFLVIRSISDKANGEATDNFGEFVNNAAKNSMKMLEGILNSL
ncbi:5'-methylthioadenosine/adenosylhomocysteine nucleosidase [Anaeromicrobium sediminis]|uniref:adenosylhomocysteine nucleosidase n=1 Tax=Anaeromicrobium sediminis TaxID=1478221 RepID=A0A267MGZ7_9FIRM|nr:5'-methylthioadenosine/adenosylhomocysteine nucleosidase [Anaeromicrobium sediminis]PAB58854.1 5'-methylthioadenosine/S-adenosylhomocysteine nucleosidase [Anaeromicrobium sediminis]